MLSRIEPLFEITKNLGNILGHIKTWNKLFGLVGWVVTDVETVHNWMLEHERSFKTLESSGAAIATLYFLLCIYEKKIWSWTTCWPSRGSNSIMLACLGSAALSQVCRLHGDRSRISLVCFDSNGWFQKYGKQNKPNYIATSCQILFEP